MVGAIERHRAGGHEAPAEGLFPGLEGPYRPDVIAGPVALTVDTQICARLRELCARNHVHERSVLLAIHLYAACRIQSTSTTASLVMSAMKSRDAELDEAPTYDVYRIRLSEGLTWLELIHEIERVSAESPAPLDSHDGVGAAVLFSYGTENPAQYLIQNPLNHTLPIFVANHGKEGLLQWSVSVLGGNLPASQLQYYCRSYVHLLDFVLADCNSVIAKDNFHDSVLKQELLTAFLGSRAPIDDMRTLPEVMRQAALERSSDTAFICGDERVSFGDFSVRVARAVAGLKFCGIGRGDKVAIFSFRTIQWAVMQIACMSTGAIYVPIDPSYPKERITHILTQAEVKLVVVTQDAFTADFAALCAEVGIPILQYAELLAAHSVDWDDICRAFCKDDVAYIQFTSGTTGTPKGAMVEHLGMMNHLAAKMDVLTLRPSDVIAQTASQCFDVSIWQLVLGLYTNVTTVIYPDEKVWNLVEYLEYTALHRVTILEMVPSYLTLAFDVLELMKRPYLGGLRYLMLTGERVTVGQLERWFSLYPDIPVINAYGPTEASDDITHLTVDRSFNASRVPIGFPIRNADIYILDEELSLVPMGSVGEICVSGLCVGRGYINRPVETSKAFVRDPFKELPVRMYRTGDFGRWLPNGSIEYWGRRDEQVKVMGVRIELAEIEQQLSRMAEIKDVAVVVRAGKLVCYYTAHDDKQEHRSIKKWLVSNLPSHSIPSKFIRVSEMPLNRNGKIDKARLN